MKCPNCGFDELIWDTKSGSVVCPNCGLVIDQIYEDSVVNVDEDIITGSYKPGHYLTLNKKETEILRNIITKNLKSKSSSKKAIYYNGNIINSDSLNAIKFLENNELLLIIFDIVNNIPKLASKHLKYKVGISIYFTNKELFNKVYKNLNINIRYFNRILSELNAVEKMTLKEKIYNTIKEHSIKSREHEVILIR